jgi:hypothetical protein
VAAVIGGLALLLVATALDVVTSGEPALVWQDGGRRIGVSASRSFAGISLFWEHRWGPARSGFHVKSEETQWLGRPIWGRGVRYYRSRGFIPATGGAEVAVSDGRKLLVSFRVIRAALAVVILVPLAFPSVRRGLARAGRVALRPLHLRRRRGFEVGPARADDGTGTGEIRGHR